MNARYRLAAAFAASLALGSSAFAQTLYSNRTAWLAATTGVSTETYESFPWAAAGGDALGSVATLGAFTYTTPGAMFGVDSTAVNYDAAYLSGQYLEWQFGNPLTISWTGAVTAIGFDLGEFYGEATPFTITLGNGYTATVNGSADAYAFFGVTHSVAFSTISIVASPYPLIDNLSIGASGAPVPEPSTYGLLGAGALAVFVALRRRARR